MDISAGFSFENFNKILERLGIVKDLAEITRQELVGKTFDDVGAAENFFTTYARIMGFGVRKGTRRTSRDGDLTIRSWVCSCEGRRDEKWCKMQPRRREPKAVTRMDCKVVLCVNKVKATRKWIVNKFVHNHSHPLLSQNHIAFLRSHRKVPDGTLEQARCMRKSGIQTCKIMSFMALQHGGYDKLPFLLKDLYNKFTEDNKVELAELDASKAIGYLEHKSDNDDQLFCKYTFDQEKRLESMIWADGKCRKDYEKFGHALLPKISVNTNQYGKSLLILLGVNNHFKTTIFAYAILHNENEQTYLWVLQSFLECMNEKAQKTVITDGCPAMNMAINQLMPRTIHRLCSWHISWNASIAVKDSNFIRDFHKLMSKCMKETQFEAKW
ncbi:protein FAR1-RELATED SEQUENCE 5-like [Humulus lupulus]|uniref:protein FAR1-RELATED SEQUENCE 5-like n=1 Tax=Humulus lupulus TaxID=3486 RepID=UPI002B415E3F|nr:protein FAR1-RELATED SEQUENCE 5-like [Humulus lupulus]